jgi:hypothetical protein
MSMRSLAIVILSVAGLALVWPAAAQTDKPPARPAAPAAQSPLPTLSMIVPPRDREAVYAFYRAEVAAGRCPPPLVRKDKACSAPGASKPVWKLDRPLADGVKGEPPPAALIGKLSPSPAGYQYLRVDNDILVVGIGTRIVAALVADLSRL